MFCCATSATAYDSESFSFCAAANFHVVVIVVAELISDFTESWEKKTRKKKKKRGRWMCVN